MLSDILVLVVVIVTLLMLWQWSILRRVRLRIGKAAPDTSAVDGPVDSPTRVYFFHSNSCVPCRKIKPLVDQLCERCTNLIKVNIAEHRQVAQSFGIAAVPCFIIVTDDVIKEVKLGSVAESWLMQWLTK